MTMAALNAGKHVVCEKAFALNAGEATEMIESARRNNRFLMEAMWTWFIPAVVDIRRRVIAGEIGEIVSVDADFCLDISDPDGRHRRAALAGGALLDLSIYPLTFPCFVLGEYPDEVRAIGRLTDGGVDAAVAGVAAFPNGTLSTFQTSLDAVIGLGARIVGTTGRIDVDPPFWFTSSFTLHSSGLIYSTSRCPTRAWPTRWLMRWSAFAMATFRAMWSRGIRRCRPCSCSTRSASRSAWSTPRNAELSDARMQTHSPQRRAR